MVTQGPFLQNYMEIKKILSEKRFFTRTIFKKQNTPGGYVISINQNSLKESDKTLTKGTFLLNYLEIGQILLEKKIFKVFTIAI